MQLEAGVFYYRISKRKTGTVAAARGDGSSDEGESAPVIGHEKWRRVVENEEERRELVYNIHAANGGNEQEL